MRTPLEAAVGRGCASLSCPRALQAALSSAARGGGSRDPGRCWADPGSAALAAGAPGSVPEASEAASERARLCGCQLSETWRGPQATARRPGRLRERAPSLAPPLPSARRRWRAEKPLARRVSFPRRRAQSRVCRARIQGLQQRGGWCSGCGCCQGAHGTHSARALLERASPRRGETARGEKAGAQARLHRTRGCHTNLNKTNPRDGGLSQRALRRFGGCREPRHEHQELGIREADVEVAARQGGVEDASARKHAHAPWTHWRCRSWRNSFCVMAPAPAVSRSRNICMQKEKQALRPEDKRRLGALTLRRWPREERSAARSCESTLSMRGWRACWRTDAECRAAKRAR